MIGPFIPPSAPADAAAIAQIGDCVTTQIFMHQPNTFERNPLTRALGGNKSLLLCLAEGAVLNIGFRHFDTSKGNWATKAFATIEAAAVGNNIRVILRAPV